MNSRYVLMAALCLLACERSHRICGSADASLEDQGAVYCAYSQQALVIEGGFECPAGAPHQSELGDYVLCSSRAIDMADPPAQVCAMLAGGCTKSQPGPAPASGMPVTPNAAVERESMAPASAFDHSTRVSSATSACDDAVADFERICPSLPQIYVAPTGRIDGSGAPDDPISDLWTARSLCDVGGCHLRLAEGSYDLSAPNDDHVLSSAAGCLHVEGGLRAGAGGEWSSGGTPSLIHGATVVSGSGAELIEHVDIEASDVGAAHDGDRPEVRQAQVLVVRDVSIHAGNSGLSLSWSGQALRVCDSEIEAVYSGIDVSWSSSDVVIDHTTITAGHSGVDIGWSSSNVTVRRSQIQGDYAAVELSWSSHHLDVEDNTLLGGEAGAVDAARDTYDIRVVGNTVTGALPMPDPSRMIEVHDNSAP